MSALNLQKFCNAVHALSEMSIGSKETELGFVCDGDFNNQVKVQLEIIRDFSLSYDLPSMKLKIDGLEEDWTSVDLEDEEISDWKLSVADKKEILSASLLVTNDIDALFFIKSDYFKNDWIKNASGLENPESTKFFKTAKPLKIYVNGIDVKFGGPRIAVLPAKSQNESLPKEWMQSTRLPQPEQIKKCIHLVSPDNSIPLPEKLLLNWGDLDNDIVQPFRKALAVSLLLTLCQEYFSKDKIVLRGKKRLEIPLYSKLSNQEVTKEQIEKLTETIEWCFAEHDESTRILLVVDRISLDINEGQCLLSSISLFSDALSEAKDRYKYVILERKKDYTKELSDLQKDISAIIDKISSAAFSFSSSLLRDLLALAFVLTAGVAVRRFVNQDALVSPEASILFKAFSVYLILSLSFRLFHTIIVKWQSKSVFMTWQNILRSYMSKEEVDNKIYNSLFPINIHYRVTVTIVSIAYIVMAIISWNMHAFLQFLGLI